MTIIAEIPFVGAGSEPVDFARAHTMGWSGWPSHKRDLQAFLQVHILGLELVKLR
jgi:hypothetical protein